MGQILSCHIKFGVLADCAYAYFHHWTTIWPSTREFKIVILVSILVSIWAGSTVMRMWRYSVNHNGMGLSDELLFSLQVNTETDIINVARRKIFRCHLNGNFNLAPFFSMDEVLLPNVLGWTGKYHDANEEESRRSRGSTFYHILRNFPELCNFPSPERKMRRQLEEGNASLKEDNASLRQKNEELALEIEDLRSNKRRRNN